MVIMKYNLMNKVVLIALLICMSYHRVSAQDVGQYNHYIANQGLLNPAYNGTRDIISGILIHRSQWIGFEGAPMSQSLNVHGPIRDTDLGAGISIINDKVGFSNTLDALASASYRLIIDKRRNTFVSLGLSLGVSSHIYDGTKAITDQFGDPVFQGKESKIGLNVGFGSYYYGENYFAGFSIPKMFSNQFDQTSEAFRNRLDFKNMTMYLYGGYVFDWNDVKIKPTILFREVYGAPLQFDVSANVLLAEKVWLGMGYRSISDVVFLAEYIIDRRFTVRYSFDQSLTSINKYAKFGSHEISLQFDLNFDKRLMRSIRYF